MSESRDCIHGHLRRSCELCEYISRIAEQDAQIAALQERVHLCAAYDELVKENAALRKERDAMKRIRERMTNYLENGGYFNPEAMEHDKVRDLILDARNAIAAIDAARANEGET